MPKRELLPQWYSGGVERLWCGVLCACVSVTMPCVEVTWAGSREERTQESVVLDEWLNKLKTGTPEVREAAALVIGRMGSKAAVAVPVLCHALRDKDPVVRERVAIALGKIRSKVAVPALISVVTDRYYEDPRYAIWALGRIGPEAKAAVPALLKAYLHDKNTAVSSDAGDALLRIGDCIVPDLVRVLDEDDEWVEGYYAAVLLGSLGPKAKDAVPALIRCLKAKKVDLREAAIRSLGEIGAGAKEAVPALAGILRERTGLFDNVEAGYRCRARAAEALGRLGPAARAALPDLLKSLKDNNATVRVRCAEAIKRIDLEGGNKEGLRR